MKSLKYILILSLSIFVFSSCVKEKTSLSGSVDFYFTGYVDGSKVRIEEKGYTGNGTYTAGSTTDNIYYTWLETHGTTFYGLTSNEEITVAVQKLFVDSYSSTCDEKKAIYDYGNYSYGSYLSETEGAIVSFVDKNGEYWDTEGDQTGSTFEVVSMEADNSYSVSYTHLTLPTIA